MCYNLGTVGGINAPYMTVATIGNIKNQLSKSCVTVNNSSHTTYYFPTQCAVYMVFIIKNTPKIFPKPCLTLSLE